MSEHGVDEKSLGELVATATRDFSLLIRKEVELAKTELASEVKKAGKSAGLLGGSGVLGAVGALFLLVAAALGISEGADLPFWVGFLVIGGAFAGVAGALALAGVSILVTFKGPDRTIRSVRTDMSWLRHPTEPPPNHDLEQLRVTHHS